MRPNNWEKTPDEVKPYEFDFAGKSNGLGGRKDFLAVGDEVIADVSLGVSPNTLILENVTVTKAGTCVRFWTRGGVLGQRYTITVTATTSAAVTVQRTNFLWVVKEL